MWDIGEGGSQTKILSVLGDFVESKPSVPPSPSPEPFGNHSLLCPASGCSAK